MGRYNRTKELTNHHKEGTTMKKTTIAFATKGYRRVELKTWEQIAEYQRRGWKIILAK